MTEDPQIVKVYMCMSDSEWRTLSQIKREIGAISEAGVSARLRDLRKPEHGGLIVQRRRVPGGNGLHQYRLMADVLR